MTGPRIRVLIVDDHKLFAEAVQSSLGEYGIDVVGTASTIAEAMPAVRTNPPDIVLMDLALPDGNGIEAGHTLLGERPELKVLALTARADGGAVKEAMRAGFCGYMTKDTPLDRLADSIRMAIDGHVVIPHRLAGAAAGVRSPEEKSAALLASHLTPREREVLALLVQGAGSDTIAKSLCVSLNTVRTHVQSILTKLQVRSRLEAAAFAVRYNIVSAHETGVDRTEAVN
jgi:two-component system nitrate/nitrite response regulator NarL